MGGGVGWVGMGGGAGWAGRVGGVGWVGGVGRVGGADDVGGADGHDPAFELVHPDVQGPDALEDQRAVRIAPAIM